jgi:hypothetical protein
MPPSTTPTKTSNGEDANLIVANNDMGKIAIAATNARSCTRRTTLRSDTNGRETVVVLDIRIAFQVWRVGQGITGDNT